VNFCAVLLAGGESRRMGRDKAILFFDREPLWQRQLRILRELEPQLIYLSARVAPPWSPAEMELLLDEVPSSGPISGIKAALRQMAQTHLVVLAVDMPFIVSGDLLRLAALARPGVGVVPVSDGYAQAVAAIYPKEAEAEFQLAVKQGHSSLQALVRKLERSGLLYLTELEEKDAARFRSVNTPEELVPVSAGEQ
jgi:molybdenum cofactor guanylyltransferase